MDDYERDDNILRRPPVNPEAERALLGALLLNNRGYERVGEYLQAQHFSDPANARVYEVMARLIEQGQAANPVTLKTYLERDELVIAAGGMKYLAGLANSVVTVVNVADYGTLVFDLWRRREMINLAEQLLNDAFEAHMDATSQDIAEDAISGLADLLESQKTSGPSTLANAVQRALLRHQAVDRGEITGLSSGLRDLDDAVGLMEPGDCIVYAGRPSMGKSALLSTVAMAVAEFFRAEARRESRKHPRNVVLFSQEMTEQDNADRAIAGATGIASPRRRTGTLSQTQWDQLARYSVDVADLPLHIDERPRATLSRIRTVSRQLQRRGGVGLIGVDYLQIMGVERGRRSDNRTQELGYLVTGLKDLAKELSCPIVVLSQLNRGVESREDKRPTLADLRESGEIEQAADIVGFCYRDQYYLERAEPKKKPDEGDEKFHARLVAWQTQLSEAHGAAEVIVAKGRHGTTGTARLRFDGPGTKFMDSARTTRTCAATLPDGRPEPPAMEMGD